MKESIIFNDSLLLMGYGIAILFYIIGIKGKVGGYLFPLLSVCFCMITTTYALLAGATLYEIGTVLLLLLILNLSVYRKNGRDDL